jgi:hypothetical protein
LAADAVSWGYDVRVWICSAGYGLVPLASRLAPYSATFGMGHPDSICGGKRAAAAREMIRIWWGLLGAWEGPAPGSPRTIADLARTSPRCPLVVVASENYLDAVRTDLGEAVQHLVDAQQLSIISAGSRPQGDLPLSPRALSKLRCRIANLRAGRADPAARRRERGWRYVADALRARGADDPSGLDAHGLEYWLGRWLALLTVPVRHPGNHKYAWPLDRHCARHLPSGQPYPKLPHPAGRVPV